LQWYRCIQGLNKPSIQSWYFFMAQGDRQQESLETLKLINAASTALRLYPEESAQVTNSIENAYQGTKLFLRDNPLLRFSFLNGGYLLNGEPVDNPTRERLRLLTFSDQLRKMELDELVLSKGFDRSTFKKILSVFSATPEQINNAGGNRALIEQLGLTGNFPEQYFAPGESEEEKKQKQKVDRILKELSGGAVRPEYILYLAGRKNETSIQRTLLQSFQSSEKSAQIIATTTYSLLQILHKDHLVVVAPAFSKMLENISSLLVGNLHGKVSAGAAALLAPYLDQCSVLMLICQDFSTPFGEHFYKALLAVTDNNTLASVLDWIKGQQKKDGNKSDKLLSQLQVVSEGYGRLVATSRGKQILALGTTREVLQKTEQGRKGKRVQTGITALAKGDLESLENKEVRLSLPATIEKLLNNDKEGVAASIIQNVVKGLKEKDCQYRLHLAQVIGGVADKLAKMNRWDWLEKLTPVCLAWIRENEVADRSLEKHVLAMQAMMNHAWYSNNSDLAERILNVFYHIRSGALEKTEAVRKLVCYVQDKNVDLVLLRGYLERCFVKPVDELICWKIVMQGPVAAKFLLDTLISSDRRSDRIRLLKILSGMGKDLVPVLLERLPDPMPWFGKRNIIRLLAETGAEEDVEAVLSYASHEDLRVQQETLQCIVRIGKASTGKYLLHVLPGASAQVKAQVVKNLRRVADDSVVAPLADLLEECRLYRGSEKRVLALEICRTLGASGTKKAFSVLQTIIDGGEKQFGKESVSAAELAITFIQERDNRKEGSQEVVRLKQQQSGAAVKESVTSSKAPPVSINYELITEYAEEKEVYALLQKDKKESAKKALVRIVEKTAQLKKFNEAEALRLRLIDIDPMALSEIIKAAEIIEEAKSNSIDQDHILIWSDLYDLLSTEEFNAFYHALEHETFSPETVIVKQGDPLWRLFFINKGRVKLFFNEEDGETLVKTLGHGSVFGGASFFDDSVWTLNAASMGAVEVSTLSMECVEEWGEVYPALETKLQDYCMRFDRVDDFFLASGAERRKDTRHPLSGTVHISLLDDEGRITDTTIRGECSDISAGGISFLSRITQRKQARTLLGRHAKIFFKDDEEDKEKMSLVGTIMAVRNLYSIELGRSVHICFDEELDQKKMMDLINGK
jgi:CRP-like cAMP-binding protein